MASQIAVIAGSLRKGSLNRELAKAVAKLAPYGWTFNHVEIGDLPLYNQDDVVPPVSTDGSVKAFR